MAQNQDKPDKRIMNPRADQDAETLRKEARHEEENEERRDVVDSDVGIDGILEKGVGGRGADDSNVSKRESPPLKDNG
ncbi:hypothetical protein ATI61_109410 [Archangium gephyra]|uniref:Uncharacterized protein n=1 Tax=Archangium gephyra TaxID=48 RepID=A0AAC8Q1U9_9BACT|nr:hypothetical protein [Archangium gephyra]AKI99387.1 Hypothetical protein AA314_01014 [Archangium gephyra]REG28066.1 hypothetical protein ATI61_109410 [Archangium gephyra]